MTIELVMQDYLGGLHGGFNERLADLYFSADATNRARILVQWREQIKSHAVHAGWLCDEESEIEFENDVEQAQEIISVNDFMKG